MQARQQWTQRETPKSSRNSCARSRFFFFVFSHFFFVSMAKALLLSGTDTRALTLNLSSRALMRVNEGEILAREPTSRTESPLERRKPSSSHWDNDEMKLTMSVKCEERGKVSIRLVVGEEMGDGKLVEFSEKFYISSSSSPKISRSPSWIF